jgi:hypothetical protein
MLTSTLIFLLGAGPTNTPLNNRRDVSAIEHFCRDAIAHSKTKGLSRARIFADTAGEPEATWASFSSEAALNAFVAEHETYAQAYSWTTDGFTLISMMLTSPSGDWTHYSDLCFRADGTLARVTDTLNTFNAGQSDQEIDAGNEGGVS